MNETVESEHQVLGIVLKPEVKASLSWKEFAGDLSAAVTDLFSKGPADAASGGVSSLVKLALSFKLEPNAGQRAWALVALSFAWSLDQIKALGDVDSARLRSAMLAAIDEAKASVGVDGIIVPTSFLERPTTIPIYSFLKKAVLDEYVPSDSGNLRNEISFKIDAAYNRAIYELWSRKPEFYTPIAEALASPTGAAAELALSWINYRHKLIYDFEVKPIFGQEDTGVSLAQLYVPLRTIWPKNENVIANPEDEEYVSLYNSDIGMLDSLLDDWLDTDNQPDWLRLIGGGPGSGKSTTMKALARRAADSSIWRPLFIPLQHIDISGDLRESINSYFLETTDSAFVQKPLSRSAVEDGPPILLLFDGLDEIAAPGEAAKDVVATFANRLSNLVSALDGGGKRLIKVVVTGRMPAFQAARKYLTPPINGSLEALGFVPQTEMSGSKEPLWLIDQREQWWRQYAISTGQSVEVPEAFSNVRLVGITHEPLLCYLLALAGYATDHWELAAENRNRIYSALVDSIYDRGWGEGTRKRQGAGKNLSKPDFNKLMETIALAAWLGGDTRVASEESFEQCIAVTGAESAWKVFSDDNGEDVTNLAMNFYLKSSEKSQRGFEFTHKSFGEYLAARALLNIASEVASDSLRRPGYALQDWFGATKSGIFNQEILAFMRDNQRLIIKEDDNGRGKKKVIKVKNSFQALAETVMIEGFPTKSDSNNWRAQEVEQANAECGLWVIISACARALSVCGHKDEALSHIKWNDNNQLETLLKRLGDKSNTLIINNCMNNIDASRQSISGIRPNSVNFNESDLSDALFASVTIVRGSFRNCDLSNLRFYDCRITNIDFYKSKMQSVIFHSSKINNCSFDEIESDLVVVSPSTMLVSDFDEVKSLEECIHIMTYKDEDNGDTVSHIKGMTEKISKMKTYKIENLVQDFKFVEGIENLFPDREF